MKQAKIISIIGLMGVGKTTIGAKLAESLGCYFIDCDEEIEDLEKKSIVEIFEEKGEKYFREVEKKVILDILKRDESIVLALGGGAFLDEQSRKILLEKSLVIWLKAPIDVVLHRIGKKNNRPLLNNVDKRSVLQKLINEREPIYSMADIAIDSSQGNYEFVIEKILDIKKSLEKVKK
jgi:shikimate kinase